MSKELKIWNGRGHGSKYDKGTFYVAAYSMKQAVELISSVSSRYITTSEIKNYYSLGSWGNSMDDIIPTEPCVYYDDYAEPKIPIRLI